MALFPNQHETIEGVGQALRAGLTTCVDVIEKCFDRIEEWETRVRAWVRVDRAGALQQARALDAELADGAWRGPLHGIPVGIKDIIDVAGLPTAAGYPPWRDRVAETDAPLVRQLRRAGAVIVGKTVTTPFAWIDPPPTRNPWNLDRTPGGSSSGSAAAVALGMCLGAIGTQTGGSIIRPASFCGVCGLKPTHAAVSAAGVFPFAPTLDHPGPIARTARDLEHLFRAIREGGPGEADRGPRREGRPPRLRRIRGFFDRRAEPAAREALDRVLAALAAAGAGVGDLPAALEAEGLLDFEAILRDHRTIMSAEAAAGHRVRFAAERDQYPPRIAAIVEEGLATPADRLRQVQADRLRRRDRIEGQLISGDPFDAFVMPSTIGPAPDTTTTGDPAFNSPWSYLGWPAVTLPIGLDPDGLPLGIQLVGVGPRVDLPLLETAAWCEDVIRRASGASSRSN